MQHCADGESALAALRKERFDAVVLDLMMPKVDGIEVLKQMRASSENRLTAVIVVTAAKLKMVEEEALRYRARLYLDKTQHDQLRAGLRDIMAERSAMNADHLRMAPAAPLADPQARRVRVSPPPPPLVEDPEPPKGLARLFRRKDE